MKIYIPVIEIRRKEIFKKELKELQDIKIEEPKRYKEICQELNPQEPKKETLQESNLSKENNNEIPMPNFNFKEEKTRQELYDEYFETHGSFIDNPLEETKKHLRATFKTDPVRFKRRNRIILALVLIIITYTLHSFFTADAKIKEEPKNIKKESKEKTLSHAQFEKRFDEIAKKSGFVRQTLSERLKND